MTDLVESELKTGGFAVSEGLASHADGVRVELSPSGIIESEASLPVHGFAVVDSPSLEQATQVATRMLRLHQDYVPDWGGSCEIRPIVTHCLP
jgi:hypothetical protein